jgi:hypothetical protein
VGGYAVRLIGRIHRAPRTIFGRAITPAAAALEADEPMIVNSLMLIGSRVHWKLALN